MEVSSSSARNAVSMEQGNDLPQIICDTEIFLPLTFYLIHPNRRFDQCLGGMIEVHFLSYVLKSVQMTVVHLGTLNHVSIVRILPKSSLYSGESHSSDGVYEQQYSHLIILTSIEGFPNATFLFCEATNNSGQGMSAKSNADFFFFHSFPLFCFYGSSNRNFITAFCVLSSFAEALHNL